MQSSISSPTDPPTFIQAKTQTNGMNFKGMNEYTSLGN